MDTSDLPVLYSFRRCPYAMRARLAIASAGLLCELREVVLRDKAKEFIETSPTATVPALKTPDGVVIDESLEIMIWVLTLHDPEQWLVPQLGTFTEMISLIEVADGDFKTALDRYKYSNRYAGADSITERTKAASFLQKLEARLATTGFLFGDRYSLADMAIAPFVRQFANVDRTWFDHQNWPHLLRWLDAFLVSDRFTLIMGKYPRWQKGDPVTRFPAS